LEKIKPWIRIRQKWMQIRTPEIKELFENSKLNKKKSFSALESGLPLTNQTVNFSSTSGTNLPKVIKFFTCNFLDLAPFWYRKFIMTVMFKLAAVNYLDYYSVDQFNNISAQISWRDH